MNRLSSLVRLIRILHLNDHARPLGLVIHMNGSLVPFAASHQSLFSVFFENIWRLFLTHYDYLATVDRL